MTRKTGRGRKRRRKRMHSQPITRNSELIAAARLCNTLCRAGASVMLWTYRLHPDELLSNWSVSAARAADRGLRIKIEPGRWYDLAPGDELLVMSDGMFYRQGMRPAQGAGEANGQSNVWARGRRRR